MSEKYILLVEDNLDEVLLAKRAFKICQLSDNLMIVHNGQEALDFLFSLASHETKPSVILLDLNLPKVGGFDVLRRIRANADTSETPVIILTSSIDDRDVSESKILGAREYIRKPTSFTDFVQIILRVKAKWIEN